MHLASQKMTFRAVSTRGKLDPHVAQPISLSIIGMLQNEAKTDPVAGGTWRLALCYAMIT